MHRFFQFWLAAIALVAPEVQGETKHPKICSVTLASDEILVELLSRAKALDQLACVTSLADSAQSNVGGLVDKSVLRADRDLEAVALRKPDVVIIASYNRPEVRETLARFGAEVVMLRDVESLADVMANVAMLGKVAKREAEAESLIGEMKARLAAIESFKAKPRVLGFGYGGNVYGRGSTFDAIVNAAGADNVTTDLVDGWGKLGAEVIARLVVDVIVVSSPVDKALKEAVKTTPGWGLLPAVQKEAFVAIDGRYLGSVSHHVVTAVEKLNEGLIRVARSP